MSPLPVNPPKEKIEQEDLWKRLEDGNLSPEELTQLLVRIANNMHARGLLQDIMEKVEKNETISPNIAKQALILREYINNALSILTPLEIKVIKLSFGLENGTVYTTRQVAETLQIPEEEAAGIYNDAIFKLEEHKSGIDSCVKEVFLANTNFST